MMKTARIVSVTRTRLDEAVAVPVSAFRDCPVFSFVLPPDIDDRDVKLAAEADVDAIRTWTLWRPNDNDAD